MNHVASPVAPIGRSPGATSEY